MHTRQWQSDGAVPEIGCMRTTAGPLPGLSGTRVSVGVNHVVTSETVPGL